MNPLRLHVIPQSEMIPNYNLNLQRLLPFTSSPRPRELLNLITLPNADVCNCVITSWVQLQDAPKKCSTWQCWCQWEESQKHRSTLLDAFEDELQSSTTAWATTRWLLIVFSCKKKTSATLNWLQTTSNVGQPIRSTCGLEMTWQHVNHEVFFPRLCTSQRKWPSLQVQWVSSTEPRRVSRCLASRKQLPGRAEGESRCCNAISPAPAGFTSFQTWHLKFRCGDEMQQARTWFMIQVTLPFGSLLWGRGGAGSGSWRDCLQRAKRVPI